MNNNYGNRLRTKFSYSQKFLDEDIKKVIEIIKTIEDEKRFYVEQMYWIPEELLEKRVHEDRVPYDIWLKRGFVRVSPGNSIDYRLIVEWFEEMQNEKDIFI